MINPRGDKRVPRQGEAFRARTSIVQMKHPRNPNPPPLLLFLPFEGLGGFEQQIKSEMSCVE